MAVHQNGRLHDHSAVVVGLVEGPTVHQDYVHWRSRDISFLRATPATPLLQKVALREAHRHHLPHTEIHPDLGDKQCDPRKFPQQCL